jgi:hypothetical protein
MRTINSLGQITLRPLTAAATPTWTPSPTGQPRLWAPDCSPLIRSSVWTIQRSELICPTGPQDHEVGVRTDRAHAALIIGATARRDGFSPAAVDELPNIKDKREYDTDQPSGRITCFMSTASTAAKALLVADMSAGKRRRARRQGNPAAHVRGDHQPGPA